MVGFVPAALVVAILVAISIWANRRFRDHSRLPMQWSFAGDVNWSAPRPLALAFTPGLATLCLLAINAAIVLGDGPRPEQEGFETLVILLVGAGFVGVHALHLWLVERTLRKIL